MPPCEHGSAVRSVKRALPDDDHRLASFCAGAWSTNCARRFRARAEIVVGVGEIGLFAIDADQDIALEIALADAGIEHRRFSPRVRADQHDRVGLVDPRDRGIE